MTETLDELIVTINQKRNCGIVMGEYGTVDPIYGVEGYGPVDAIFPITVEVARSILYSLLRWDQAYGNELMSAEEAVDFTKRFFSLFSNEALQCYTNTINPMDAHPYTISDGITYSRMMCGTWGYGRITDATFDTFIYIVTPDRSGYCAFGDED